MSLVASIFGDVTTASPAKKKNAALVSLFDHHHETTEESDLQKGLTKGDNDKEEEGSDSDSDDSSSSSSSSSDSSSDDGDGDSHASNHDNANKGEDDKNDKDPKKAKKDTKKKDVKKGAKKKDDKKSTKPTNSTTEIEDDKDNSNDNDNDNNDNDSPKEDEEERTVFVGNLPLSTTRRSLAKVFGDCGKVQSTRLRSVAVAGVKVPHNRAGDQNLVKKVCTFTRQLDIDAKSSLQGYVVFADKESVPKALALNNKALQDEDPKATRAIRRMRVDTASPTLDPKRSVFVGNMPYQADEASLAEHFVRGCNFDVADIQGVRIIRDKETFQCKGFGYVLFQDSTMVATALQRMQDSLYMKRPLRVKVCGKSIKGRRGHDKKRKSDNGDSASGGGGNANNKRPRQSLEGKKQPTGATTTPTKATPSPVEGAMRRVKKKNKRVRGEKKKNLPPGAKPGVSKRAAADAKVDKKVKKLQKRAAKGMGKTRK